ncbi:tetratricopeptide repeat protein [Lentzea tibetensis]|uniref:Tetratricopeptide repeat protein n=1 Tax=Lentzea tibetensis TaxID=2591470 RepID=A0A563ERC0_9PSEU|nr:AfsR/SARP family transcriptional regulator [Lentzea tibetensis]TWP50209.1 tetratricopeptide repeat protein [Lentzea tibetensis]
MTRIRLLGAVEVHVGGTPHPVGRPLLRGVLTLLALQAGEAVPVEKMIDAVWDEALSDDARGLIHGYVSGLRKVLRPAGVQISRRGPGYALEVERDHVDLLMFRSLVARARAEEDPGLLRDALALWRGDPLAGVPRTTFFDGMRTTLTEEHLVVAEEWVEHELRAGRHREVLPELSVLVAGNPLRETLVAALMRTLYRNGRQADALRCYETTRSRLADELGLDPSGELRSLHERILRADEELLERQPPPPEAEPARGRNALPLDVADFTGRSPEVDRVLAELPAPGTTAVLVVDGMAGVGKTTLAVHVAQRLRDRYPDAQLFVDLHGFTAGRQPVEPVAALDVLLRSLGVPAAEIPNDVDQRIAAWRTELAGRRAVIVLDNVADSAQVDPLISGAPDCLVIVTSRRRLRTVHGAVLLSLDVLADDDALALLTRVLGDRVAAEPDAARELVRLCGGLPLAIRIAAARLLHRPQWAVEDAVERFREERRRHSDIAAAFALSYRDLGPAHQRMFRLLGLHPGTDVDALAAAALADVPYLDADDLLEDLLDLHLVEQRARGRYTMHDLVRDHARALVDAEEPAREQQKATGRLLDYYLHVAHFAADLLQPGRREPGPTVGRVPARLPRLRDTQTAMGWFTSEHANLVALARLAAASGFDRAASELPSHVGNYLVISERVDDLVAIQEPAAEAARRLGDPVAESRSQYHLALTRYMQCQYRAGLTHADRTLALARDVADQARESMALVVRGMLLHRLGDYADAMAAYEAALPIQQQQNNYRHAAITIANQGRVHLTLGQLAGAREQLDKALIKNREIGERSEEGSVLAALGAVHARLGEHEQAAELLAEALELAREVGNTHYEMRALIKSADARRRAGDLAAAASFGERAVEMLGHGRSADHLATAHNVLGDIAFDRGDVPAAIAHHTQARYLAERIEYLAELEHALDGLARTRS